MDLLKHVRQLAGVRRLSALPRPRVEIVGTIARTGYEIDKLVIQTEEDIWLPSLLFVPDKAPFGPLVLYVHDRGKSIDGGPGGPIEQRVLAGDTVLAVDLRGTGQTKASEQLSYDPSPDVYPQEFGDAMIAYMLGRSYVGMRTEDILICAKYMAEKWGGGQEGVQLVAVGDVGIPALHAAALEPSLFQRVTLSKTLISWSNVLHCRPISRRQAINLVHGARFCTTTFPILRPSSATSS